MDTVTPDMLIAHQRLHELREEAEVQRLAGQVATGRLAHWFRDLLNRAA